MEEDTDTQLVARARADDTDAFRCLAERYQPLAFYLALRMVGREAIAHELVQEALLQAYLSLERLQDDGRFKSWFYGIVLNLCRNWRRQHPASELSLDYQLPPSDHLLSADPQEIVEERELKQAVRLAVDILSPRNQEVASLFYYEDMSMQEISRKLAISISAVKNRLLKGRQQLRAHLQKLYPEAVSAASPQGKRDVPLRLYLAKVVRRRQPFYDNQYLLLLDEHWQRAWIPAVSDFRDPILPMHLSQPSERPSVKWDSGDVLVQMIHALGGSIKEVLIEELYEDLLYARVVLGGRHGVHIVKAALDDALRLIIHERPPIFITAAAFEQRSIALIDYGPKREQQLASIEQLMRDTPHLLRSYRTSNNLDFSQGTRGWTIDNAHGSLETHPTPGGKTALALTVHAEGITPHVIILSHQSFSADEYRGKRIRATAYLKADSVQQPIFNMKLSGPFTFPAGIFEEDQQHISYLSSSERMRIVDMQNWTPHILVMDVSQEARTLGFSFSVREPGDGTIWLDRITLEEVSNDIQVTDTKIAPTPLQPVNLDFARGFLGWELTGNAIWQYERGIDTSMAIPGERSAFLKSISTEPDSPCTLQQIVKTQRYRGKTIHLSADIKTATARRIRFFCKHFLGRSNSVEEIITETTDWATYHLTLPIEADNYALVFGVTLDGIGQLWLKNIQFQVVEEPS